MISNRSGRIVKNTGFLYIRVIVIILINLFTSRILLQNLGVEDFGIYNVVGGIVFLLSFFNLPMLSAVQRFLAFDLAVGDSENLKKTFSFTITIQLGIAIVILILAETVGLWFLNHHLNIPLERLPAANWVYQFAILIFIVSFLQIPYVAVIIVHEKMNYYAIISMIDALFKLIVAFLVSYQSFDVLKTYSFLMFFFTFIVFLLYRFYCIKYFLKYKFSFLWDKSKFKELFSYIGWSSMDGIATVGLYQGTNIILNMYFGSIVNAARAISIQVKSSVSYLGSNIRVAVNPQIVKSYAQGDEKYVENLLSQTSKYSFVLVFILSLPLFLEMDYVLELWLKNVPQYTSIFCLLFLVNNLIDSLSLPLLLGIQATGNIRFYQLFAGILQLLNLPVIVLCLNRGMEPYVALYVNMVMLILVTVLRLFCAKRTLRFNVFLYFRDVIIPCLFLVVLSSVLPYLLHVIIGKGLFRLAAVFSSSILLVLFFAYFIVLKSNEQQNIIHFIKSKF